MVTEKGQREQERTQEEIHRKSSKAPLLHSKLCPSHEIIEKTMLFPLKADTDPELDNGAFGELDKMLDRQNVSGAAPEATQPAPATQEDEARASACNLHLAWFGFR